ncbi:hypothetical protein F2Q70_00031611 [Brassica cretica]|uniref:Uncharacterized protein n=1 Tax=Brassica cretica TaxID=69181 RepID=A0A8S9FIE0_BRACR|nr:hypothetical protein F2Q70_00031611 [Brassica cretica]
MAAETIDIGGEDQPVGGDQTSQGTEVVMWKCQNARADRLAKGGRLRKLNPSVSAFAPIWLAPEASLMAAE